MLTLLTPQGWQSFPIAGIYADYASTRGTVRMSLDVYRRMWSDDRLNGVALFLAPGADVDAVTADLTCPVDQLSQYTGQSQRCAAQGGIGGVRPHLRHHHGHAGGHNAGGIYRHTEFLACLAVGKST